MPISIKMHSIAVTHTEIPELAGRVCGPHKLLDLCATNPAAKGNRGSDNEVWISHRTQAKTKLSTQKEEQKNRDIYGNGGNEQPVGESQLVIRALPLHDQHWLPRPRAAEKDRTIQTARGAEKAPWTMIVPPTSGTPPGVPGGLSITLMKLINKSTVQNGPHINEPPHRIGWRPLYESRRQRGRYQALEGGAKDGSFLGNMGDIRRIVSQSPPAVHRTLSKT